MKQQGCRALQAPSFKQYVQPQEGPEKGITMGEPDVNLCRVLGNSIAGDCMNAALTRTQEKAVLPAASADC